MKAFYCTTTLALLAVASQARAQTPACGQLSGPQQQLARELLDSQRPYDCCDKSIAECLTHKPVCSLALRLAENICRRVAKGQTRERIVRALSRRAGGALQAGDKAQIDLSASPRAGDANAPITLVEYACPRCPYCARITPQMYHAVVKGKLKGKVKFYFKVFPIRGHAYAKEGGLALLAAAELGRFWPFALRFYQRFDEFCVTKLPEWAQAAGMDATAFSDRLAAPATRERLVRSKKEGIVNEVDATPTFFINGRKYAGELNAEELADVLEEVFERSRGIRFVESNSAP